MQKSYILSKAVLAFLLSCSSAASSVVNLTPDNFDAIVSDVNRPALIKFFKPGCRPCDEIATIYEELAAKLEKDDLAVTIAEADCRDPALNEKNLSNLVPMVMWYNGNSTSPEIYARNRTVEAYTQFVKEKLGIEKPLDDIPAVRQSDSSDTSSAVLQKGADAEGREWRDEL